MTYSTDTTAEIETLVEQLVESWLPTNYLTAAVLLCQGKSGAMWADVSTTYESALDFYRSLEEDDRRLAAAEILAHNGWDVRRVAARKA